MLIPNVSKSILILTLSITLTLNLELIRIVKYESIKCNKSGEQYK